MTSHIAKQKFPVKSLKALEISMIVYFREDNGDFLAIETGTNAYYRRNFGKDQFEGRGTAIAAQVGSVCTTGIARTYLRAKCRRVAKAKVPGDWLRAIGY